MRQHWILTLCMLFCVWSAAWAATPWPKCAVRSGVQGGPAIVIDGEPYVPVLFNGNNQFNRDEVLLGEFRQAAEAGIRLFNFNVNLDWHASPEETAETVAKFCAACPDGYFYVRVWLGPNDAWREAHPDECVTTADGTRLPYASPSSTVWRAEAAQQLEKRVREIIEGPFAGRFIGVCPTYLQTGEWFYERTDEFMDYSPANLSAFREWLKKVYRSDKRLRDAWHDQKVTLETAAFPSPEARDAAALGPFRDPAAHRPAIDMQRYQNELIADTIAYFAAVVKRVTKGRSLTGAFYGYTMELNQNGPRALAHSGHLAFARLLDSPDLDLIHAPYSYFERGIGQPAHLHLPVDSVALRGKLAVLEEDTFTHSAQSLPGNPIAPGWREQTQSLEETLAVSIRNAGLFLTHRCGFWYFDLFSDGRWSDPGFWKSVPLVRRMAAQLRSEPPFAPEVAFLISEASVYYLRDTTHPYLLESLARWRAELDRTGTPIGYYLQSDLPRLPESVKVLILANPFELNDLERTTVRKRLLHGATVIWTYAPDIVGPSGIDPSRITAVTGIPVVSKSTDAPLVIASELTPETQTVAGKGWDLRFIVTSSEGINVVARYEDSGEISAAACPAGQGVSLYTATPRLPVGLLREVFRRAGVHLYDDLPGMVGVVGPYLIVHTDGGMPDETVDEILADMRADKAHTFSWPTACAAVSRIVPPRPWPLEVSEERNWRDVLPGAVTAVYRCE